MRRPARATAALAVCVCAPAIFVFLGATNASASPLPNTITTVAGSDYPGPSAATSIPVNAQAVAAGAGNLYVTDTQLSVVRKVDSTGTQTVVAGNGTYGYSGDGGQASAAAVYDPQGVAIEGSGNVVIADSGNNRVRVAPTTSGTLYGQAMTAGDVYTIAGNGTMGYSGDTGIGTSAELDFPQAIAVDSSGNAVVADTYNNRIRVVAESTGTFYGIAMTAGDIYTIAGNGTGGYSGNGGAATSAELEFPQGIAVASSGNIVIADTNNNRIRVVAESTGTFYGMAMTAGDIYTIAGNGVDNYAGDGGPATSAELYFASAVAVDSSGNAVIADTDNDRIRVVAESTGTFYGIAMTAGDIYTIAGNGKYGYAGDGGPATATSLYDPEGVAVDSSGNVVIADTVDYRLRVVAGSTGTFYGQAMTAGDIYTVAGNGASRSTGDGGAATSGNLDQPQGVAVTGSGNVIISDTSDFRLRVAAGSTGTFFGQSMTAGDIYTIAGNGSQGYSGDGGPATSADLGNAAGIAVDSSGNVIIAEGSYDRIRVVAASTGTFYSQAMTAGDIYTIAGTGSGYYGGDGGPATSAELFYPEGVAVDGSGNVVIADADNERVRVVAESTGTFYGQAMTKGDIYTIGGDGTFGYSGDGAAATSAELYFPYGVATDGAGNVLIADRNNDRIRVISASTGTYYGVAMTAGDIYTIAGNGTRGYSGDGGPATSAEFYFPQGLTVDSSGNVVVADAYNNVIRVVAASTGTYYGVAMTAGDIYTVAGNGTGAGTGTGEFSGDGGPATSAGLSDPVAVALDSSGDLFIADTDSNRIREVAEASVTTPPASISGVTLTGTPVSPTVTVTGTNFGTQPTGTLETCRNGDTGDDFATGALSFEDLTENWNAGKPGNCIGLVITSWSSTQVVFTFGTEYSVFGPINSGDQIEPTVEGATDTVSASFPTTSISGVTLTGTPASPTVTVTGTNFGTQPTGTLETCRNGDTGDDFATGALSFEDLTENWNAGKPGNCIGLVITSWSSTQVVFTFGTEYSVFGPINSGDQIEPTVEGATDTVSASFPTTSISGVTLTGTPASPTVTVTGTNFGTQPTGTLETCRNGDTGDDFATGALSFEDLTENWNAGKPGNCIGLVITSWSSTQVVFTFGTEYSVFGPINSGDQIEPTVEGATDTVTASFPTTSISGVTLTGTPASPTVTVTGTNFGTQPTGTLETCRNGDTGDDFATGALSFEDLTENWNAGKPGNCIGLVITSWSSTQVVFTFGTEYSVFGPINSGDQIEPTVEGATDTVSASFPTTSISGVTLTGTPASPTVTVTGTNFGTQPTGTLETCRNGDTGDDFATGALSFEDLTENWNAGKPGNCIGLVITSWSSTQVVFTFGTEYSVFGPINSGDQIEPTVEGATDTVSASFPVGG